MLTGLLGVIVWWPDAVGLSVVVLGVWGFGAIEYVDYFVVRLAYPMSDWVTSVVRWRAPRLLQDLEGASAR